MEKVPVKNRIIGEKYLRKGWQVIIWKGGRRFDCEHERDPYKCKECGGTGWCEHGRLQTTCKECEGGTICEHGKRRSICKECGGGYICEHDLQRSHCRQCNGSVFCEHGKYRPICKKCGGIGWCKHGKRKSRCIDCEGTGICKHGRVRGRCVECEGGQICEHKKRRQECMICDPQNALAHLLRTRVRLALKSSSHKLQKRDVDTTHELIGCTIDICREHIESQFTEGMNWENHGKGEDKWNIDHRRPCASFNLENEDERRMCFHYTNLQPLWAIENQEKGDTFDKGSFDWRWDGDKWVKK